MRSRYALTYIFTATLLLIPVSSASGADSHQLVTNTQDGGRGLSLTRSALTVGKGHYNIGLQGLVMEKDYPLANSTGLINETTALYGIPLTFGLTEDMDISGSFNFFNNVRPYANELNVFDYYDDASSGIGSARLSIQQSLPLRIGTVFRTAARAGVMLGTSSETIDGMNYHRAHSGTDIEVSIMESYSPTSFMDIHFEQGVIRSGSDIYDDQLVVGAGIEIRPNPSIVIGLEAYNRSWNSHGPQSAFQAGPDPSGWSDPAAIGNPAKLLEDDIDFGSDYFVFAPSISFTISENLSLNTGALINIADHVEPKEDIQIMAGITFRGAFDFMIDSDEDGIKNNRDREADTPRGYPVNSWGISIDSDKDGVADGGDSELHTPAGAVVDVTGHGIDGDEDGVYDGLDREPDTAHGCPVDEFGVALDSDKDGVIDCLDREPATPEGCPVDDFGVALDDDADGVPNGLDREPDSPWGCEGQVDEFGVALDDDGDGVPNCVDLEADTAPGSVVDKLGKAIIDDDEKSLLDEGMIRIHKIHFETESSDITKESYASIRHLADILAKYPTLKIQVEGHTDSSGSRRLNTRLSKERAQAVLDFMLKYKPELDRKQFTVVGHGPDKAISPNDTAYGRQMNRRVEFVVLNMDELRRLRRN